MGDKLLIRDVPPELYNWIQKTRTRSGQTQNELVLEALRFATMNTEQLPLFQPRRVASTGTRIRFRFIDLFAGIGGLRLGLESAGGECVFSCEWDRWAQKTYYAWYHDAVHGDIREVDASEIPDHDVLAAGFPCQPFSIAGVSKKKSLGRAHGFQDAKQGNLFFELVRIIREKRPPILLLENVKNLKSHDGGRTWTVIRTTLEDLGYLVLAKVIDAAAWVPQHRERVFIVCFDRKRYPGHVDFEFPEPDPNTKPRLRDILEKRVDDRYTLTNGLWTYLQEYAEKHKTKGNGFGFGLADLNGVSRTLSARYYKDGSEILIPQRGKNPRRLAPRECARLMGFPDELPIVVSDTQAYRQFGNAVSPLVAAAIARELQPALRQLRKRPRKKP